MLFIYIYILWKKKIPQRRWKHWPRVEINLKICIKYLKDLDSDQFYSCWIWIRIRIKYTGLDPNPHPGGPMMNGSNWSGIRIHNTALQSKLSGHCRAFSGLRLSCYRLMKFCYRLFILSCPSFSFWSHFQLFVVLSAFPSVPDPYLFGLKDPAPDQDRPFFQLKH